MLYASDAVRNFGSGRTLAAWRNDDDDLVGEAAIIRCSRSAIRLRYSQFDLGYLRLPPGEIEIELVWQKLKCSKRVLFVCINCNVARAKTVIGPRHWSCQVCNKLRYRDITIIEARSMRRTRNRALSKTRDQASGYLDLVEKRRELMRHFGVEKWSAFADVTVAAPIWREAGTGFDAGREEELPQRPEPPRYLEAYPVLSAKDAREASLRGEFLCLWMDERSRIIGGAEIDFGSVEQVRVRYALQRRPTHEGGAGDITFDLARVGSMETNKRQLLVCPTCAHARSSLAFVKGSWSCRECHGLYNRTALVGTRVRKAEKLAGLEGDLERLQLAARSGKAIQKKKEEIVALEAELGSGPHPTANKNFSHFVRAYWQRRKFSEDGFYDSVRPEELLESVKQ